MTPVTADMERLEDDTWHARQVALFRTARLLMRSEVCVRV